MSDSAPPSRPHPLMMSTGKRLRRLRSTACHQRRRGQQPVLARPRFVGAPSPSPSLSISLSHLPSLQSDGSVVFKSYDKSSGVSLRSSKVSIPPPPPFPSLPLPLQMKTPMTLGQKKTKAIDQLLEELGVGTSLSLSLYSDPYSLYPPGLKPMSTEQICVQFNELR